MFKNERDYNGAISIENLNVHLEPLMWKHKYCFVYNDQEYFFKFGRHGDEGYRELVGEELAKMYYVDHAKYDLATLDGKLGCVSESVAKPDEEFIDLYFYSISNLNLKGWPNTYNNIHDMKNIILSSACPDRVDIELDKYINLFLFDVTIGNYDRNFSNQGFIKKDGVYRLSAAFDSAELASSRAMNHEFSQGIDGEDTELTIKYKEQTKTDVLVKILNDPYLGSRLRYNVEYLSDDRIDEAFRRVEDKIGTEMNPYYKATLRNDLIKYRNHLLMFMSDYYENVNIKTRG